MSTVTNGDRRIRLRRLIAVVLYVLAAVWGLCQGMRPDSAALLVFGLAMASAMTFWCVLDSRIRGRPIVTSLHLLIFLAWPLAVPVYLLHSRKVRGFVLALAHGVALLVLWWTLFSAPAYANYWFATAAHRALVAEDYDRAASLANWAVVLRPEDAASWHNLGTGLFAQDRAQAAAEAFQRALALDPTHETRTALVSCKWQLAAAAYDASDLATAKGLYREAIAIDRTVSGSWYGLGLVREALGEVPAAIEALERACELDPENQEYRARLDLGRRKCEGARGQSANHESRD